MDEFTRQLQDIALGHAAIAKAGIEAGELAAIPYRNALHRIVAAYDAMTDYERMILPTVFRQAIEAAR